MSEVVIDRNYSMALWETKLRFTGSLPVNLGYCRVSTDEQADEGYSLESQQKNGREWCDRRYGKGKYHLILVVEDESGTLPFDRGGMAKGTFRPGLTLAVEICRKHKVESFIVARLNRLMRRARIYYELDEDVLQPNGIELHAIHEGISNKGSAQRLYAAIVAACAESERDNIVSVSRDGLKNRMDQLYFLRPGAVRLAMGLVTPAEKQTVQSQTRR